MARIAAALAVLAALYAVAGFVIAPRLARSAIEGGIEQHLGLKAAVGEIHIDPFLFRVRMSDFALADPTGKPLLGFERLDVDFEPTSLLRGRYSFKRIELTAPYLDAAVAADGTLNLTALRPRSAPPAADRADAPLPRVHVGLLKVSRGTLGYEDASRRPAFASRLEPVDFELREFETNSAGGQFQFSGASSLGEHVDWQGHLWVQPLASDGTLHIRGLHAGTIAAYLGDRIPFAIDSGRIDLAVRYRLEIGETPEGEVTVEKLALTDFRIRPRTADTAPIALPAFTVSDARLDVARRAAHIESATLEGLTVSLLRKADGTLNLLDLAAPAAPAAPAAAPAPTAAGTTAPAPAAAAGPTLTISATAPGAVPPPWQLALHRLEIRGACITAEDHSVQPAARGVISDLSLALTDLSLDLAKPVQVALDARINTSGSLHLEGAATPQPAAADLKIQLSGVDLSAAQPYILERTAMTLRSGRLSTEAQMHYQTAVPGRPHAPVLRLTGNLRLEDLRTTDDDLHDDFINARRLDIRGFTVEQNPDRIEIAEVSAQRPYARVIVESDSSLNLQRVLRLQGGAAAAPAAPPARGGAAAASAAPVPVSIKRVRVHDGQLNFTDLSVAPNFSAGIQSLEGGVLGLSSRPSSRAKVELKGNVDAYSPVAISGELNVLSAALYTDLAMSFHNMELSIFNPYSGKFAGYAIAKGKLTTDLHYRIDGRRLDAQHHIVIDQLEFGDKTASKDAVSLPVKLAVALLKDRHGVIDLNLPVGGSLDDPTFRVGPVLWHALVTFLEKAITAPFALLGSLFGGGPDLQFVDFDPGKSTLDGPAADKMHALAQALAERPQLKIEIPIGVVAEIDRPALIEARLEAQIRAEAQAQADPQVDAKARTGAKARTEAKAASPTDPSARLALLTALYRRMIGSAPLYPPAIVAQKKTPDALAAKIDFLSSALREHLDIGETELRALGEQRAQSLEQTLLKDTGIDPARVFLVARDKATARDNRVRLELSLE